MSPLPEEEGGGGTALANNCHESNVNTRPSTLLPNKKPDNLRQRWVEIDF